MEKGSEGEREAEKREGKREQKERKGEGGGGLFGAREVTKKR